MTDDLLTSGSERDPLIPEMPALGALRGRDHWVALGLLVLTTVVALGAKALPQVELPTSVLALGAMIGVGLGAQAGAVAYVFRQTGVLALSGFGLGVLGVALVGRLAQSSSGSYYPALAGGAAACAAVSLGVGLLAQRRSPWDASALTLVLATATVAIAPRLLADGLAGSYPRPPGLPEFHIGPLLVMGTYQLIVVIGLLVTGALVVLLRMSAPTWVSWLLLGAALGAIDVPTEATRGFSSGLGSLLQGALILIAVGVAGLRPMTSVVVGVAMGVLEHAILWNAPEVGNTLVVGIAGVIAATVWSRRGVRLPAAPLQRARALHAVPTLILLGAAALGLWLVGEGRDAAAIGLTLAVGTVALSQVLLRAEPGLDLSPLVVAVVGVQAAVRLSAATQELLILGPVIIMTSGVAMVLLRRIVRPTAALPVLGVSLALTMRFTGRWWVDEDPLGIELAGRYLGSFQKSGVVVVILAAVSALAAGLARTHSEWVRHAVSGAIAGAGALGLSLFLFEDPLTLTSLDLVLLTVACAAAVSARSASLVLLATAASYGVANGLVAHGHNSSTAQATSAAVLLVLVLATPALLSRWDRRSVG